MSLETSLKRCCRPAVLGRARRLAADADKFFRRRCRYLDDETTITARVDSSSSWDGPHRCSASMVESEGLITFFECDCENARRNAGLCCKHVAALVLDFAERPELYDGYESASLVRTSRVLTQLMERASSAEVPTAGASTETCKHTVDFEPTISYEAGFGVRFRLIGEQGSYVLKSISDFVSCMENKSFYSYGKRLSFAHVGDAFTGRGQRVADFLVRAVRNRRAYAFDRAVGAGPLGSNGAPQRSMHLSSVELWDLLSIYEGTRILFEDRGSMREGDEISRSLLVTTGDPQVSFSLEPLGEGAMELVRHGSVRLVTSGGRALAWDDQALYCCSESLSQGALPLAGVLADPSEHLVVSERDALTFMAQGLPLLENAVSVEVSPELEELRPEPCELQFYLDRNKEGVLCEAFAAYGSHKVSLMERSDGDTGLVRDVLVEAAARTMLRRYFSLGEDGSLMVADSDYDGMARLVFEGVPELQRTGTVYATDAFDRLKSKARPKARMELSVRSNLLDLRLSSDDLSARDLAELLESYSLRKRYHRLRDGSFVDLADADLSDAVEVVEELGISSRDLAKGKATVPAYRALLLDADVGETWRDASLEEYLSAINGAGAQTYEAPDSLQGTLRPYQLDGFAWMSSLVDQGLGGILADEMGLGKSVQLISLLLARRKEARSIGPSLVVCPASLVYNWAQEFAKFSPQLEVFVVAGSAEERSEIRGRQCDVLITSYDLVRRDVEEYANARLWLVALDEAQYIKNHGTLVAQAVKSLVCEHRFALTGTPVENRLSELWSIVDFLMPGFLGPYESFRERFERPALEEGQRDRTDMLGRALGPFILRRTKREVLHDLPDKLEQVVYARMDTEQRNLYEALVSELRTQLSEQTGEQEEGSDNRGRMQILAALTRLRQTCCDPRLVFENYEGTSCKTDTIATLVERVVDAGERLLLFSQFTSYLDILAQRLSERGISYVVLTGSTPKRRRMELVEEFNTGTTQVFLISLKAGGTGLNLTGASVVIHADPWWNAAAQDQATDRAHRIGQTRDVTVYKVICADTLEERIQEMQRRKADLANQVIGAAGTGGLSMAELSELLA